MSIEGSDVKNIHFVAHPNYQVYSSCKGRLCYRLFKTKLTVCELYLSLSSLSNRSPTKVGTHVVKVSFFLKSVKCLLMNTGLRIST